MSGYRTPRLATDADDAALSALARSVTMRGELSYVLEREPSFLAMTRAQGEGGRVMVVEDETGAIVACALSAPMMAHLDGAPRRILYVGDLKVHPAHRAQGVAERAAIACAESFEREGHDLAWGVVLSSNRAVQRFFGRTTELVRFHPGAEIEMWNVYFGPQRARDAVRRARPEDAPEMVALWNEVHRERQLSPVLDARDPLRALERFPGLTIGDYCVRERGGRVVAFVSAWDAYAVKQVRLVSLSRSLRAVRAVHDLVAPRFGRARLPRDGEHLRFLYAAMWCAREVDDLRAVLAALHDAHARGPYAYFDIAFDPRDPMARALRTFPLKSKVSFRLALLTWGAHQPPVLRDVPAFFEPAIV